MNSATNFEQYSRDELLKIIETNESAIRKNPHDIDALIQLSQAHLKLPDFQAATHALTKVIKIDNSQVWAYHELANILMRFQKPDEAKNIIRQALLLDPNNSQSHTTFGTLLSEENNLIAGEWHFRRALELIEDNPSTQSNLALCLMQQGKTDEAYTLYQRASELAPDDFKTLAYWSKLCEVTGNLKQADLLLEKASSIASPAEVDLLRSNYLARTGQYEQAIEIISKSKNPSGDALLERGRAYDRLGLYDNAWEDFVNGKNKILQEAPNLEYQTQAIGTFFDELRSFFTADILAQLPTARIRKDCPQPIFILGSPRSGTTLTERVLSSHSQISAGGELTFLPELRELANKLLPSQNFPKNLAYSCAADYQHIATLFRDQYLARAESCGLLNGSVRFFTDKMPFNEIYLPILKMAFPKSPIIQLTRHPLDTCISMMSHRINHGFHCAYRVDSIFHHLSAVCKLNQHYLQATEANVLQLKYENFVHAQELETKRVLDYIDLPFQESCLNFQSNNSYTPTPSYIQVQSKVTDAAIERHKNYHLHLKPYASKYSALLSDQGY